MCVCTRCVAAAACVRFEFVCVGLIALSLRAAKLGGGLLKSMDVRRCSCGNTIELLSLDYSNRSKSQLTYGTCNNFVE